MALLCGNLQVILLLGFCLCTVVGFMCCFFCTLHTCVWSSSKILWLSFPLWHPCKNFKHCKDKGTMTGLQILRTILSHFPVMVRSIVSQLMPCAAYVSKIENTLGNLNFDWDNLPLPWVLLRWHGLPWETYILKVDVKESHPNRWLSF